MPARLIRMIAITVACRGAPYLPGPPEGGVADGPGIVRDAGGDRGDAGVAPDGPGTVVAGEALVLRQGTAGLLLRGVVLAPDGVLDPGEVLIADGAIACVAADCGGEPAAADATWIDTRGTISPGLIDAHNHVAYNFLPEWVPRPPRLFDHRYQWAEDPQYEAHIAPYARHRSANSHFCPAAKWGELRSLIHATTTMQSQPSGSGSCIDWGIRNADEYHGLGHDHMRNYIGSVRDIDDGYARDLLADFAAERDPVTRFAVHMAEGIRGGGVTEELASFAGRDPRPGRHQGVSLLEPGTGVLIHSIALTDAELQEVAETGTPIVWSPSSNLALYGVTAPIARILELGIPVGLGPDWTPSGEDELLSELRFARALATAEGVAALTPERLWRMATSEGALVLGLDDRVGLLQPGHRGDVAVFGRTGADPYQAVIDSRAADVRLVLIDGAGWYGDAELAPFVARNASCDELDACGRAKFLCVQDAPDAGNRRHETLGDIERQLVDILDGNGYPPEEQYGRGHELLPLVDCAR